MGAENNLLKLRVTERFAFGIFGLNHPIGVEEKSIARADGYFANRIVGLTRHTENQAVAFNTMQMFPRVTGAAGDGLRRSSALCNSGCR